MHFHKLNGPKHLKSLMVTRKWYGHNAFSQLNGHMQNNKLNGYTQLSKLNSHLLFLFFLPASSRNNRWACKNQLIASLHYAFLIYKLIFKSSEVTRKFKVMSYSAYDNSLMVNCTFTSVMVTRSLRLIVMCA